MHSFLFALISYLGWGVGDVFGTIATRKLDAYSTTFWRLLVALLLFSAFVPFILSELGGLSWQVFLLNIILSVVGIIGLVAFYEGLKVGNAAVVGTVAASFAAVAVLFSVLFLDEIITSEQLGAISLIFLGVILSGLNLGELKRNSRRVFNKGTGFALIAMFFWGIYSTFIKIPVQEIGWFFPAFISLFFAIPVLLVFMRIRKLPLRTPRSLSLVSTVFLNGILLTVAEFSYNFAISKGLTALIIPIAGSYPTLFVLLAALVFKDPITKQQIAGITVTLLGIILLSILIA